MGADLTLDPCPETAPLPVVAAAPQGAPGVLVGAAADESLRLQLANLTRRARMVADQPTHETTRRT